MRELRFFPALTGNVRMERNKKGELESRPDKSEYRLLRVKKEDVSNLQATLNWACRDSLDFHIEEISEEKNVVIFETPGRWIPELSEEDIHSLVDDYKSLGAMYDKRSEIFGPLSQGLLEEVLLFLIDRQDGGDMRDLPPYIRRVLQLRKQEEKNHG